MRDHSIEYLCKLVAPPKEPQHNRGNWEEVESDLNLRLPDDYKRLIDRFGQGVFVGEAYCSGLSISSYLMPRAVERATAFSECLRSILPIPYPTYPDRPGLLGCGSYADKDTFAWHTAGPQDEWTIVYHHRESGIHEVRGMTFLEFVISVLKETSPLHKSRVIRKGNMKGPHTFCPEL